MDIGVLKRQDRILKTIGEELMREKYENLNFYFITDEKYLAGDYIIAFEEDESLIGDEKGIFLSKRAEDGNKIFFYQGKEAIKEEILRKLGEIKKISKALKLVAAISSIKRYSGTIFSYFLAKYLGDMKYKVCWLPLNYAFPYEYLLKGSDYSGLLKALYYFENRERIGESVIKKEGSFNYIGNDLKTADFKSIQTEFWREIKELLEALDYDYLILDSCPSFFLSQLEGLISLAPFGNPIEEEIFKREERLDDRKLFYLRGKDITYGNFYTLKENKIVFNGEREEYISWKKILKNQFSAN